MTYRGADPTAVMGTRIGAYVLDGLVAVIVLGIIGFGLFTSTVRTAPGGTVTCPGQFEPSPGIVYCSDDGVAEVRYLTTADVDEIQAKLTLIGLALTILNSIILQGLVGASVGKLLLGLRVVRADGNDAGLGRCLVRTILLIVDGFFCSLVGLLTAFNSRGHRRVGDMVAGTLVVSRSDQDALILARSGIALPDRTAMAAATYRGPVDQPAPVDAFDLSAPLLPTETAPATVTRTATAEQATWDPARGTYVQYDHHRATWMAWDEVAREWKPIA